MGDDSPVWLYEQTILENYLNKKITETVGHPLSIAECSHCDADLTSHKSGALPPLHYTRTVSCKNGVRVEYHRGFQTEDYRILRQINGLLFEDISPPVIPKCRGPPDHLNSARNIRYGEPRRYFAPMHIEQAVADTLPSYWAFHRGRNYRSAPSTPNETVSFTYPSGAHLSILFRCGEHWGPLKYFNQQAVVMVPDKEALALVLRAYSDIPRKRLFGLFRKVKGRNDTHYDLFNATAAINTENKVEQGYGCLDRFLANARTQ